MLEHSQNKASANSDAFVMSYTGLRKSVGLLGLFLTFVLVLGNFLLVGKGVEDSISDYYYTVMRDVFVGCLCAIGVFLFSYHGYGKLDDVTGNVACVCAIGTAFFPTASDNSATQLDKIIGHIHYFFAGGFFLTLAFFCLILFRKTDVTKSMTINKVKRNYIYTVCGYGILCSVFCLLLLGVFFSDAQVDHIDPIFWLETVAVVLFGISWLVKGEVIFGDLFIQSYY